MKKLIGCLLLLALLPVAFMAGCGSSSTPTSSNPAATSTPTVAVTATKTNTVTNTATQTGTLTLTSTFTNTATSTFTSTFTNTATNTVTSTMTSTPQAGPAMVNLGSAANYVILAYNSITNSGATTVCSGLVGENPGSSVTGYNSPMGTFMECGGADITPDFSAAAGTAEIALGNAYNDAASRSPTVLANPELGGLTKTPGVYGSTPSLDITGTLTLDGTGYANGGVFIFQTAGILTTATSSSIVLLGGAQAANIFWQVGNYASLGATSSFDGNIMSATYVALNTGAVLDGRAMSETSYVSLLANNISVY